ncbi:MAG: SPASM domain-containing protein, partial [Nitrosopumilus sp.]
CVLGVGFVVNKENYLEIFDAAKIFKDLGVDNFRISGAFTPLGYKYFEHFKDEALELAKQAEELSDDNFTVFNLFNDRLRDLFEGVQDYDFCSIKELQCYVGADQKVYLCCTLSYNEKGLIGSIHDKSFRELWQSNEKISLFSEHNPRKMCKHQCIYKNKNEFINYCIKNDPKHINFI